MHALVKAGNTDALVRALFSQVGREDQELNAKNEMGQTPLSVAASAGRFECVEALLAFGACPNIVDADGLAPLHTASFMGHLEIVCLLLVSGANVGAMDQNAWTPLHYAAQGGYAKIVHALLGHGARQIPDKHGLSPLAVALKLDNYGVICVFGW